MPLPLVAGLGVLSVCAFFSHRTHVYGMWCAAWVLGFLAYAVQHQKPEQKTCEKPSDVWQVRINSVLTRELTSSSNVIRSGKIAFLSQRCGGYWFPYEGSAYVSFAEEGPVGRGDVIQWHMKVSQEPSVYTALMDVKGLSHRVHVGSSYVVVQKSQSFLRALDTLRDRMAISLEKSLPLQDAAMAKALVLGDQSSISEDVRDTWSQAGITHVISVSGLHMGVLAWLMLFVFKKTIQHMPHAGERFSVQRVSAACALPCVLAYTALVGFQSAAVRSCIMTCVWLVSCMLRRPSFLWNAFGCALMLILLYDPNAIADPGFLLSFSGVAALAWMPTLEQGRFKTWLKNTFLASVCACLFTAPVAVYFFGTVSWVAPLANMLAVPFASCVATPYAAVLAVLGPFFHNTFFYSVLAKGWGWVLICLNTWAHGCASLPYAFAYVPKPYVYEYALYAASVVLFYGFLKSKHKKNLLYAVLSIGLCVAVRVHERFYGTGALVWVQAYVGQGDGAVLVFPKGSVMVVDGGGSVHPKAPDPGKKTMARLLRDLNIHSIDTLVLSHPHPDHAGGLVSLSSMFPVKNYVYGGTGEDYFLHTQIAQHVRAWKGRVLTKTSGQHETVEGVKVSWFQTENPEEVSANNASLVLMLEYAGKKMLLTGDIEEETEEILAAAIGPVDVLKAPHHGSRTSSTQTFLTHTHPSWVLVSCGVDNFFGFPHEEVLQRYHAQGVHVARTDQQGHLKIHVSSKGRVRMLPQWGEVFSVR